MLVSVAAPRPWKGPDGEYDLAEPGKVIQDTLAAVAAGLAREVPGPAAEPEALPLGPDKAQEILEKVGGMQAAWETTDQHPSLRAEEGQDEPEPAAAEKEVGPMYRFVDRLNQAGTSPPGRSPSGTRSTGRGCGRAAPRTH
ncbi:hypothetical protein HX747_30360 [Streptomyces sp. L06]|nr:hypothetical protein [Streptomyces sp. L06]